MSNALSHFFIKLLLVPALIAFTLTSYAPQVSAVATGSVSLDITQTIEGYASPVFVKASAINGASFSDELSILLKKNGQTITSLPITQGPSANSAIFMITPGLPAGEYDIVFNQPSSAQYQSHFSIVAPSVQLMEGNQPFTATSSGYNPKIISVTGSHTNFLSSTSISLTRAGTVSTIPSKITNIIIQDATHLLFTLESGLTAGEYNIRISNNGVIMDQKFIVAAAYSGISITAAKSTLEASEELQLQVLGQAGEQSNIDLTRSASVSYESSDPSLLSVSSTGLVKALKSSSGKLVTVTATLNEGGSTLTHTARFKVTSSLASMDIMPNPIVLEIKKNLVLKVLAAYEDGSTGDITGDVIWTVGNLNIASINGSGQITGKGIGSTTITATKGSKSVIKTVTVTTASTNASSGQSGQPILDSARNPILETPQQGTVLPILVDSKGNAAKLTINQAAALDIIHKASENTFVIPVKGSFNNIEVAIPEQMLTSLRGKDSNSTIKVVSDKAEFAIPAKALKLDELKAAHGINSSLDIEVRILIQETEGLTSAKAENDALKAGSRVVITPIDFKVELIQNNTVISISSFDRTYVTRSFEVQASQIIPDKTTAAMYIPELHTFRHVPTKFALTEQGTIKANFKRNGNSTYTLLETALSFKDVKGDYWAKKNIDVMASKLILQGIGNSLFNPEGKVTRAQFASIITRSIGLLPEAASGKFQDVPKDAWYAGEVQAAFNAGIISGRSELRFDPNAPILRQEMAAIIVNAMVFAGKSREDVVTNTDSFLSKFKDRDSIAPYARPAVAYAASQGIISGMTSSTFQAKQPATRAQASTMVLRMLRVLDFVN